METTMPSNLALDDELLTAAHLAGGLKTTSWPPASRTNAGDTASKAPPPIY
jgi:hypothetical protein